MPKAKLNHQLESQTHARTFPIPPSRFGYGRNDSASRTLHSRVSNDCSERQPRQRSRIWQPDWRGSRQNPNERDFPIRSVAKKRSIELLGIGIAMGFKRGDKRSIGSAPMRRTAYAKRTSERDGEISWTRSYERRMRIFTLEIILVALIALTVLIVCLFITWEAFQKNL